MTFNFKQLDLNDLSFSSISKEQNEAIDCVENWYRNREKDYFVLAGCAGTGKSFIIPYIIKKLNLNLPDVAICAYTGKAAKLLRNKSLLARTIHNLIYQAEEKQDKQGNKYLEFHKITSIPHNIQLIVVDEASMVSQEIHYDLMSYGVPILYVGDYFQLPPINSNFHLLSEQMIDYKLTTIYRQAENNHIIKISMDIRNGCSIPFGSYGTNLVKTSANKIDDDLYKNANQIICGKHDNRMALNCYLRELFGFQGYPKKGEKLIILRNNYNFGVVNGQQIILMQDAENRSLNTLFIEYMDEYDFEDAVKLLLSQRFKHLFSDFYFNNRRKNKNDKEFVKNIEADFGYAITVHKSQGSEWNNVILYDDGFGKQNTETRARWLYTAVTRAKEKLYWLVA